MDLIMYMTRLLAATFVAIALAGCSSDGGADASLTYSGAANGTHSDSTKCDDQGTIKGSGSIPDGDVLITLTDSAGKQLLSQTFKGEFTLASQTVSGASGTWKMDASRTGDDLVGDAFSGDYEFFVDC